MFAIAEITFKKIKEPAFFIMLILALGVGYITSEVEPMSKQSQDLFFSDILSTADGYEILSSTFFIFMVSVLISIFAGASEIPRDISSGMIMLLLTKPVKKTEYLIGKFLGVLLLTTIFFTLGEVTSILSHLIKAGELYPIGLIVRQFLLLLLLMPLVAMTVMVSCYMTEISAMIVTTAYIVIAAPLSLTPIFISALPQSYGVSTYFGVIYYFFPNFIYFFVSMKITGLVTLSMIIYSLSLTVIYLAIASVRINRRDLI